MNDDDPVSRLAEWASGLSFDDIPEDVRQRAALIIVDDLACAIASRTEPEILAMSRQLPPGLSEATIFLGDNRRTDRATAAMINAIAANWCQLDEGHRKIMCHAGLYAVPAAVAEAEASGATVREVLRAVVISYEIVCRFAQTWQFQPVTVHPHAAWPAIGAAVAVAALRQFDALHFQTALTSAATMALAGPFQHGIRGALIQNTWAGVGVWSGFRCADWAGIGIGGLQSSPSDVFGTVLSAQASTAALTALLGEDWAVRGGYHKLYSCAQQSHAVVEATLRLRTRWPRTMRPKNVARLHIEAHRLALTMDNRQPPTTLAARFSVPHIVAAVCVFGRADAEAFAASTLDHSDIVRLRDMVQVGLFEPEMPWPHDRPARVHVVFDDGTSLTEECLSAEGGPDRPFSTPAILRKVAAATRDVYPVFAEVAEELCKPAEAIMEWKWADLLSPRKRKPIRRKENDTWD